MRKESETDRDRDKEKLRKNKKLRECRKKRKNTGLVVHTFKPLRNKGKKEKRSASHDKSPED